MDLVALSRRTGLSLFFEDKPKLNLRFRCQKAGLHSHCHVAELAW